MRVVGALISSLCFSSSYSHISVLRRLGFEMLRHFRSVLNLSRSEVDKTSPLLLQSFDFSTLYTKIDLMDLKAHMKVLINKVFHWILKLHCFKFLFVQRSALNFRFLWLKNKE
jgi:hypothetical protein